MNKSASTTLCLLAAAAMAVTASSCKTAPSDGQFVARVGSEYLKPEDVASAFAHLPAGADSGEIVQQITDRWITDILLVQEARRRRLEGNDEVKRRLRDSERSVLISALLDELYQESAEPSEEQVRDYYLKNRESLRTREPYVKIRYLVSADSSAIAEARRELLADRSSGSGDSEWERRVEALPPDVERTLEQSTTYQPETSLFGSQPPLWRALEALRVGQMSQVVKAKGLFHLIYLVDKKPAGTIPELEWQRDEIVGRVQRQLRKQMYAAQVQRLKNEARSRGTLEIQEF